MTLPDINNRIGISNNVAWSWVNWEQLQFPHATQLSRVHHLQREALELFDAINDHESDERIAEECIDCIGLLHNILANIQSGCDAESVSLNKLAKNKSRSWGEPDKDGISEHIQ